MTRAGFVLWVYAMTAWLALSGCAFPPANTRANVFLPSCLFFCSAKASASDTHDAAEPSTNKGTQP